MIATIKTSEIKQGAKGDYLYITYIDHKDNSEHRKAIFATLKPKWGLIVDGTTLELKQDARYNVTDILPIEIETQPVSHEPYPEESKLVAEAVKMGAEVIEEKMTKGDWDEKDRRTRKSIERQKSLELAVEVAKIKGSDTTEKIIATSKLFEKYLETGE